MCNETDKTLQTHLFEPVFYKPLYNLSFKWDTLQGLLKIDILT
jgi:hypothetical protein